MRGARTCLARGCDTLLGHDADDLCRTCGALADWRREKREERS